MQEANNEATSGEKMIRHDLHLSLVAAENQACFEACVGGYLEDEPDTPEDMGYNRALCHCLRAIHERTLADAQAALKARDKRVREEALREAAALASATSHDGDYVAEQILALTEREQTDE